MNVLLWRSEILGRRQPGSPVPVANVWEKMVNTPDLSSLDIRHRGAKIGYCRWFPSVGEAARTAGSPEALEGMVREPLGYEIDLSGFVVLPGDDRVRFQCELKLTTHHAWREFIVHVQMRPYQWEVRSQAAQQKVTLITSAGEERRERVFSFAELRNPEPLLRELGGPWLPTTLAALGVPLEWNGASPPPLDLQWEARQDSFQFGRSRVRAYRLQARLLGRFEAAVYVSPIGEILRVELPDNLVLANDVLAAL